MPTDRDLIAEGRKFADLFTDHAVFSAAGKEDMRRLLRGLADALEEAQRPPLGYVVLIKRPLLVSGHRYEPVGSVEHDAEFLAYRKTQHPLNDSGYVFAEVREVQP